MKNFLTVGTVAVSVAAWVALILAAVTSWGPDEDLALLIQTIAALGTCYLIVRASSAPVVEVYLAGKRAGRHEVLAEQECGVAQLAERRLSIVGGDR